MSVNNEWYSASGAGYPTCRFENPQKEQPVIKITVDVSQPPSFPHTYSNWSDVLFRENIQDTPPSRPPKDRYIGFDRFAEYKALRGSDGLPIMIDGHKVTYYEYPSFSGHQCRIEVVEGPEWLGGWLSREYSGKHCWRAQKACINALNNEIATHQQRIQNEKAAAAAAAAAKAAPAAPDVSTSAPQGKTEPVPETAQSAPKSAGKGKTPPEAASAAPKDAQKDNDDFPPEPAQSDPELVPGEVEEESDEEDSKLECSAKSQKADTPKGKKAPTGYRWVKQAQKTTQGANRDIGESFSKLQKLDTLQKQLDQAPDSIQKQNLQGIFNQIRKNNEAAILRGSERLVAAKVEKVAGKAFIAADAQLKEEFENHKVNMLDAVGSNVADALLNYDQYKSLSDASLHVAHASAKSVLISSVEKVGLEAIKGAANEIAPALAKRIPGLNTINSTYTIGKTIIFANTPREAIVNGVHAGLNVGISYGCAAAGQAIIPIPFVGSFCGSCVGGLITKGTDWLFFS